MTRWSLWESVSCSVAMKLTVGWGGGTPWDALGCLKEKWTYAEDNSWNRCETKYFISQSCPHPLWKGNERAGLTCSSSDRALFLSKIPWPGQIPFPVTPLPTARGDSPGGGRGFPYTVQALRARGMVTREARVTVTHMLPRAVSPQFSAGFFCPHAIRKHSFVNAKTTLVYW